LLETREPPRRKIEKRKWKLEEGFIARKRCDGEEVLAGGGLGMTGYERKAREEGEKKG
jgi:hypothetical protein